MGYLKIHNLYNKPEAINWFKEVYCLEKVHGTSAHIRFSEKGELKYFFSGGEKHDNFVKLFNKEELEKLYKDKGYPAATIYGEAYGGKQQRMSHTYGKETRFIVFDVLLTESDSWLPVPEAQKFANYLGLEFVPYERIEFTEELVNRERDRPSRVAKLRGIEEDRISEGVVIRPLNEMRYNGGSRVIYKHKHPTFSEVANPKKTLSEPPEVYATVQEAVNQFVVEERFRHVVSKFQADTGIETFGYPDTLYLAERVIDDVIAEEPSAVEVFSLKIIKSAVCKKIKEFMPKHDAFVGVVKKRFISSEPVNI